MSLKDITSLEEEEGRKIRFLEVDLGNYGQQWDIEDITERYTVDSN